MHFLIHKLCYPRTYIVYNTTNLTSLLEKHLKFTYNLTKYQRARNEKKVCNKLIFNLYYFLKNKFQSYGHKHKQDVRAFSEQFNKMILFEHYTMIETLSFIFFENKMYTIH